MGARGAATSLDAKRDRDTNGPAVLDSMAPALRLRADGLQEGRAGFMIDAWNVVSRGPERSGFRAVNRRSATSP